MQASLEPTLGPAEILKWSEVKVAESCPTLGNPMDWSHQAPLSMGFSRQECWSGLPCPPSGNLPNPGIKCTSLMSPASGSLWLVPPGKPTDFIKRLLIRHVDGVHGWVCLVVRFFFNCYKLKRNALWASFPLLSLPTTLTQICWDWQSCRRSQPSCLVPVL